MVGTVSLFKHAICFTFCFQDEKFDEAQGPTMSDLVLAEDVDMLPYMGWQQLPDVDKKKELVRGSSFPVVHFMQSIIED